ncbi:MAG: M3 family oligoendopeptidase [bacterium]|nr:M3 family oligoendopeptidase [bacterium]
MPKSAGKAKINVNKVYWNLSELYTGQDDPKLEKDFKSMERACKTFAKNYRGRVGKLDAKEMRKALKAMEKIDTISYSVVIYAMLEFATKSTDPNWGAFRQKVMERNSRAFENLSFFQVEWAKLSAAKAKALTTDKTLIRFKHFLEHSRLYKKHTLSEKEEILATKLGQIGGGAWSRYYTTVLSDVEYVFRGKKITASELVAKLQHADRDVRRDASETRTAGLSAQAKPLTFAFNMILAGCKTEDEIRSYDTWVQSRNLSNEIPDKVVDSLVKACLERGDILRRYMKLKKKLMGVKQMMSYDVSAPLPGAREKKSDYATARKDVVELFEETTPAFGKIARDMFEQDHIDAPPYKGKRSGAFCMSNMSGLPYVMLNWTGKTRDVATMAHELGHAVHAELSRDKGPLGQTDSLVMAEVASVFMETLLYNKLLKQTKSPRARLDMLKNIIEDGFSTTLRQMQFNRFENSVHNHRREKGELTREQFCEYFQEAEKAYFGNTVKPHKGTDVFWMYVQHFMAVPGYVYAYCASYLVVLSLYKRYLDEGESFLVGYEAMLAAGGNKTPEELLSALGVDWSQESFWHSGLDVLDGFVEQFKTAAKELKLL